MNLLPQVPRYFKANLHTHTNISDGSMTPEEATALYRENGYQILCLTDHNVIADHTDKNGEDFLMLTGVEININDDRYVPTKGYTGQSYHLLMISKEATNLWQPIAPTEWKHSHPYLPLLRHDGMPEIYHVDAINDIIARAKEHGFLVAYCHPEWSGQSYPDYAGLKGLWAMELRNHGSVLMGMDQNNHLIYQDFLELGNRMFPLGTDDAHSVRSALGAWVMVGAEALTYPSVMAALEKGDFYASCGPQIHSLTLEDGILSVTCSDADRICLYTETRFAKSIYPQPGQPLRSAQIDVSPWLEKSKDDPNAFLRVTVYAPDGSYAATRGYWMDELKG